MPSISVQIKFDGEFWRQISGAIESNVDGETGRSKMSMKISDKALIIYIEASDTGAIRAALGSITKWIQIADRVYKEI